jgi:thiamine-monophosphate kinase
MLADRLGSPPAGETWIGDDAAVVGWTRGPLVLAVDAVVAGVHADLGLVGLSDLGWKAVAAAVSDIGAMGARPRHALVTMCVPPAVDLADLNDGVADAAREWGCAVVGGDLCASGQIMVSVAVTGTLEGEGGRAVTRSGASPGDLLLVTGPLGASAAGLRLLRDRRAGGARGSEGVVDALVEAHRRPRARVAEGELARFAGASAMIDVSDGFGLDLHRLARASGVGVDVRDLPVAVGATASEALGGGEDYELIIATADAGRLCDLFDRAGLRRPVLIGECTGDAGERHLRGRPMPPSGWRHDLG